MIDIPSGVEESRAKQLEAQKARLSQCTETGKVGFVFTEMYSPNGLIKLQGPKKLQGPSKLPQSNFDEDFGRISDEIIGILPVDDMTGYLIVDCSGKEGSKTPRLVANDMAKILNDRENKSYGKPWSGAYFSSYCPAPMSEESDERILGEATLHTRKLQSLRDNQTRVTPLPFLGKSK